MSCAVLDLVLHGFRQPSLSADCASLFAMFRPPPIIGATVKRLSNVVFPIPL